MNTLEPKRIYSDITCTRCRGRGVYQNSDNNCTICKGGGWEIACSCYVGDVPAANCPLCNGVGWRGPLNDKEREESFECRCSHGPKRHCECHTRIKINAMTAKARIPAKNLSCTVSGYKYITKAEKQVKSHVQKWFESYPAAAGRPGLMLIGAPGTGKTHLATALCNALIRLKFVQPLYASCTEMMAKAMARIKDDTIVDPFVYPAEVEVLCLDDLGAEKPTEWGVTLFAELIDYRYRNAMPMIITSNLSLAEIEGIYGPRITDRIFEMCEILNCDGPSRRRPNMEAAHDAI